MPRFNALDYEYAHGMAPRGRGRWALSCERHPDILDETKICWTNGTLTDAKREAKKKFPEAKIIYILS